MTRWIWALGGLLFVASVAFVAISNRAPIPEATSIATPERYGGIHVEVLNGCGVDGVAHQVSRQLRSLGFDVMSWTNAPSFNYPESIVIDRIGKPEFARKVADALGIHNQIQQIIPDPFRIEQVTVIVGRDFKHLTLSPMN